MVFLSTASRTCINGGRDKRIQARNGNDATGRFVSPGSMAKKRETTGARLFSVYMARSNNYGPPVLAV